MARVAGRLGRRLSEVEARHAARRARVAAEPPFDAARLTAAELAELEPLKRRVPRCGGRPNFSGLSDAEFERLACLYYKGTGRAWRGGS